MAEAEAAADPRSPEALASRRDALAALGRMVEMAGAEGALRRMGP